MTRLLRQGRGEGEWEEIALPRDRRSATVRCPDCGARSSLSAHSITDDGSVQPSFSCPDDCGFHDYIRLAGWVP